LARSAVRAGSAAHRLIQRLAWTAEYAIADTEMSYYALIGLPTQQAQARARFQALMRRHRFDGVVLENNFSLRRANPAVTRNDALYAYDLYRTRW
jgi:hypothetical protein